MTGQHAIGGILIFFLVLGVSSASLGGGRKAGGWEAVENVNDPHVQELGQFAVSELNRKEKTELRFVRVVRGATQVVAGENYSLVIAAEDKGITNNYEVVILEKARENFKELTSFKRV